MPASATVSVLGYWRMGESDAGASSGSVITNLTDSAGTHTLQITGTPVYSADVSTAAAGATGSALSANFTGPSGFGLVSNVFTQPDNFGVETWVKPGSDVTNGKTLVYNGSTATSGWGLVMGSSTYSVLFGGSVVFGSAPAVPNTWVHLALVRTQGTNTLYVNGAPASSYVGGFYPASGNFAVGAPPQLGSSQAVSGAFSGLVDEVRVFSFAPGQFSPNDLLLNAQQSSRYALGTASIVVGAPVGTNTITIGTTSPTDAWTATANAPWLHIEPSSQSGAGTTNIVFGFDANPGATRASTLTVAGKPVTVTQAGTNYVASPSTPLFMTNLPCGGVAVDTAGNVFFTDSNNRRVQKMSATDNSLSTVISNGLQSPQGVAVSASGDLFIADAVTNRVFKWSGGVLSTLVSNLNGPFGVAVDAAGNVFIADTSANSIKKWMAATGLVTNLIPAASGLSSPGGVAVDVGGNLFISDGGNQAVKKWTAATASMTTLVSNGLTDPFGIAVDGGGNVYFGDYGAGTVKRWSAFDGTVTTLASGLSFNRGVAVDSAANCYFADSNNARLGKLYRAFLDPSPKSEPAPAGGDALTVVLPNTANLAAPYATTDQSWLTVTSTVAGTLRFGFSANVGPIRTGHISLLGQTITVTQAAPVYTLGTTSLLLGPAAGSGSVVLSVEPSVASWTATTNAPWLHLSVPNQSGTGSQTVVFTLDANPGATRVGTLTVAGQTVTVTQAGSGYVTPYPFAGLISQGLLNPQGVAVDAAGNVYVADVGNQVIKKLTLADSSVTTLVASGLSGSFRIALDATGNVFIADNQNSAVKEWNAASGALSTLVSGGLNGPYGVAVDRSGNVFIADSLNNAIKKWSAASQLVSTLPIGGLAGPQGVAVDAAGNVYVADAGNQRIIQWNLTTLTTTPLATGLNRPVSVAVNGSGDVYFADSNANVIRKWSAASQTLFPMSCPGLSSPSDVAIGPTGDLYVCDAGHNEIKQLSVALVDSTPVLLQASGGSRALPPVLPLAESLGVPFTAPYADQSWITITSGLGNPAAFAVAASTNGRSGNIIVLGQFVSVVQSPPAYALGANLLTEGPGGGTDGVLLSVAPELAIWTASVNVPWMHLTATNQSGAGSRLLRFTLDANPGATRTGALSVGGQTLTVTQAGAPYVPSVTVMPMANVSGLFPATMAADNAGNLYAANPSAGGAIQRGSQLNASIYVFTNLVNGLNVPSGVALDAAGNLYFSEYANNSIRKWSVTNGILTTLVSSNLNQPVGTALDILGNVYFSDSGNNAVKEWLAASNTVITLVSNLNQPNSVAVDVIGNVYFADTLNNVVKKWSVADGSVTPLISGLNAPRSVAVDGSGNVYVADTLNNSVKKWDAITGAVTNTVPGGLNGPSGVCLDVFGNLYIADTGNNLVKKLPRAFIDVTTRNEGGDSGNDSLPVLVPSSQNLLALLAPVSDQSWLTVNGSSNGIVNFSFTGNTNPPRSGNITVLGRPVAVAQSGPSYTLGVGTLYEGPQPGTDSISLAVSPETGVWTATSSVPWLHLSSGSQRGTGSTNVIFSFDSNAGVTRSGSLLIGGGILTIVQAGSTYVTAPSPTTNLVPVGAFVGLAVDAAGNLYFGNYNFNSVQRWNVTDGTITDLVTTNISSVVAVAVDGAGNVYYSDNRLGTIQEWLAATGASTNITSGIPSPPFNLAVDRAGNVFYADGSALWKVAPGSTNQILLLPPGAPYPAGVAVNQAGNLFFSDTGDNTLKRWNPKMTNQTPVVLVSSGLSNPRDVALDAEGNVYVVDASNTVKKWSAVSNTLTTIMSGVDTPGLAADNQGNVYLPHGSGNGITKQVRAFADTSPKFVGLNAGSDVLPVVLPPSTWLGGFFAPQTNQPWLSINGVTNGVVSFAFSSSASSRTGQIDVLNLTVPIIQTLIVSSPVLTGVQRLTNGSFRFSFTNNQTTNFTVLASTNLTLPLTNWTVLGAPSNAAPNLFQFTIPITNAQRYFRVRSP